MTLDPTPVLKEKAMAACTAYQQAVEHANKEKLRYQTVELPQVFADMYDLEVRRRFEVNA